MLLYLISIICIIQKNPDFLDDRLNLFFFIVSVQIMFLSHQT